MPFADPEERRAYQRRYHRVYQKNKDRIEYRKKWYDENSERVKEAVKSRRDRLKEAASRETVEKDGSE